MKMPSTLRQIQTMERTYRRYPELYAMKFRYLIKWHALFLDPVRPPQVSDHLRWAACRALLCSSMVVKQVQYCRSDAKTLPHHGPALHNRKGNSTECSGINGTRDSDNCFMTWIALSSSSFSALLVPCGNNRHVGGKTQEVPVAPCLRPCTVTNIALSTDSVLTSFVFGTGISNALQQGGCPAHTRSTLQVTRTSRCHATRIAALGEPSDPRLQLKHRWLPVIVPSRSITYPWQSRHQERSRRCHLAMGALRAGLLNCQHCWDNKGSKRSPETRACTDIAALSTQPLPR